MAVIMLHSGESVLVDDADLPYLSSFKWYRKPAPRNTYALTSINMGRNKSRKLLMHRMLLGQPAGQLVDHINGDGLDNRRENLRLCTRGQNNANVPAQAISSSQYKGVTRSLWRARGCVDGRSVNLGDHETEEAAARAYDAWAMEAHGEFAWLNFPPEGWIQHGQKIHL